VLLGLPRPFSIAFSSVFASIVSELTKLNGREKNNIFNSYSTIVENYIQTFSRQKQKPHFSSFSVHNEKTETEKIKTENEKMESEKEKSEIDWSEVVGDVSKWLTYDLLLSAATATVGTGNSSPLLHCEIGACAAVVGLGTKEFLTDWKVIKNGLLSSISSGSIVSANEGVMHGKENSSKINHQLNLQQLKVENRNISNRVNAAAKTASKRFASAALEGAVLFGFYDVILMVLQMSVPEQLNVKFEFNQIIEQVEQKML
jgi:hypothetical protein